MNVKSKITDNCEFFDIFFMYKKSDDRYFYTILRFNVRIMIKSNKYFKLNDKM